MLSVLNIRPKECFWCERKSSKLKTYEWEKEFVPQRERERERERENLRFVETSLGERERETELVCVGDQRKLG